MITEHKGTIVQHSQATPNLESIAIAQILQDFGDTQPTAAQVDAAAHNMTQAELDVGYAQLLDPFVTPGEARMEVTELAIYGANTSAQNSPIPIPSLSDDATAIQLVGQPGGFHLLF